MNSNTDAPAGTEYHVVYHGGKPTAMARITPDMNVERVTRNSGGWEPYPDLITLRWSPDSHFNWDQITKAEADRIYPVLVAQAKASTPA